MGFTSATTFLMGPPPSASKSPSSLPNGSRLGKSRLKHVSRSVTESSAGKAGRPAQVDERHVHIGGAVRPPPAGPPRGKPERPRARFVMMRIKRPVRHRARRVRLYPQHRIHRKSLRGVFPPRVRNDQVFVARLVEQNRLRGLLEQIDHRRTAQPESFLRHPDFQALLALRAFERRNQNQHFRRACRIPPWRSSENRPGRRRGISAGTRSIPATAGTRQTSDADTAAALRSLRIPPDAAAHAGSVSGCFFDPGVRSRTRIWRQLFASNS